MNDRAKFSDPHLESLLPEVKFSRRGFIASSVATGFALSAGALMAQTAINTPATGLDSGMVSIPVAGGNMPGYMAAPKKAGKYATVIVIPEIFGMHEYQKDICRRLAKAGYYAIVPDLYTRKADLTKLTSMDEIRPMFNFS